MALCYVPPQPFSVTQAGAQVRIVARDFEATFDARRGALPVALSVRDWAGLRQLAAGPLGDIVLKAGGRQWKISSGHMTGSWKIRQTADGIIYLTAGPVILRHSSGRPAPFQATLSYTIFAEGALFCDLQLRSTTSSDLAIETCSLEFPWLTGQLKPVGLYAKYATGWGGDLEQLPRSVQVRPAGPVSHAGFMYGRGKGYCAAVEMVLENQVSLLPDRKPSFVILPEGSAASLFRWQLHTGQPVPLARTRLPAGLKLRWGICVSRMRQRSIAIGQRIAHWQEGRSNLMSFPSDSAIEAMALAGVTVNVLHLYWSQHWGRGHIPVDRAEMDRWVASCKRYGIRPVLYVVPVDKPGIDGINASWYRDYGVGGLYFDFGAVKFNLARYKADYPAMDYLKLTRHYRDVVGPDGLMIAHCSAPFPDLVFLRNIDAYLPGEARHHALMLRSWPQAFWHGGLAVAVSHPWCEYPNWQTKHATAIFASIGAFPHVLFGRGTHEDNNYHRCVIFPASFVLPYWQMLRTIPMDRDTIMYNEATRPVADVSGADAHWVIYHRPPDWLLAIVTNLGKPTQATLTLDANALKISGRWRGWMLFDDVTRPPQKLSIKSPVIPIGLLKTDEYRAVVMVRAGSRAEEQLSQRLAQVAELRRQLLNKTPPQAPLAPAARPALGLVKLTWKRPASRAHICEYRIYRSDAGSAPLAAAEECTYYLDFTAPPGKRITYRVAAVDIAGNEGEAAPVAVTIARGDLFCEDFSEGLGSLRPLQGQWRVSEGILLGGKSYPIARREGDTFRFQPTKARFVRIYFRGGRGNFDNAHIVEARVFDAAGQRLPIAKVSVPGYDPGHPPEAIIDDNLDQSKSCWWSNRKLGLPSWAILDLGAERTVASVWVLTFTDGRRWYDYSVELSTDGKTWREVGKSERPPGRCIILGPALPENATLCVTMRQVEKYRVPAGLLFGADEQGNGYALILDDNWDGRLIACRISAGRVRLVKAINFGHSIYRPIPHLLQVIIRGDVAECWCDAAKAFEVSLADAPGRRTGLICTKGRAAFDNFQAASASVSRSSARPLSLIGRSLLASLVQAGVPRP